MEHPILDGLKEIYGSNPNANMQTAMDYMAKALNPDTPSHEISIINVVANGFKTMRDVSEDQHIRLEGLINDVVGVLDERGYRADYSTYQEHKLIGSTQWIGYAEEPHKPIGVIKGDLTVEEANRARELSKVNGAMGQYFCSNDFVKISLEFLDEDGNTVRDPQILDDELNPVPTKYSDDFPFRRISNL